MKHRFTPSTQRLLVEAQIAARALEHGYIGTEHLLLAALVVDSGAKAALTETSVDPAAVRTYFDESHGQVAGVAPKNPPYSPRTKKVLELALREALDLGSDYIAPEHVLLAICKEGEGTAARWLDLHAEGGLLGLRSAILAVVPVGERQPSRVTVAQRSMARSVRREGRVTITEQPMTPAAQQAIASTRGVTDTGALLLSLAAAEGSAAAQALAKLGVSADQLRDALASVDVKGTADEPPLPPSVRLVDRTGASMVIDGGDLLRYAAERAADLAAQGLATVTTAPDGGLDVELNEGLADLLAGFATWKAQA